MMYTELQKHIVKALTTLFFQDKEKGAKYWDVTSNRLIDINNDESEYAYRFAYICMDERDYIVIREIEYDDYGCCKEIKDLCYILVNLDRACWDLINYAIMIENVITYQISL